MPIKPIKRMGNPILRQQARILNEQQFGTQNLKLIIQDLKDTMLSAGGLGIAAPQIGISLQICIIQVPENSPRYGKLTPFPRTVLINPEITPLTDLKQGFWQGCLSIPGIRGYVERPRQIRVKYYTQNGEKKQIQVEGFGAVVFQHQLDHLNGILFIDKIVNKKIAFVDEFQQFGLDKGQNVLDD